MRAFACTNARDALIHHCVFFLFTCLGPCANANAREMEFIRPSLRLSKCCTLTVRVAPVKNNSCSNRAAARKFHDSQNDLLSATAKRSTERGPRLSVVERTSSAAEDRCLNKLSDCLPSTIVLRMFAITRTR